MKKLLIVLVASGFSLVTIADQKALNHQLNQNSQNIDK